MASSGDIFLNAKVRVDRRGLERDINSAFRGISGSSTFSPKIDGRSFTQPLGRITSQIGEFDKSLDAATARVLAFTATTSVINGIQNAFRALVAETVAVEESLAQINVVLNTSTRQLSEFGDSLFDIARNTQQSFLAAAEAATEFSRQGLGLAETLQRTSDALILTRLSGLDATKAVEALTAAVNGFARAGIDTTEVINKLANVDAAFAVSTRDLTEALSRAGSTAQDANVSFDELLGLVTSVQQQTARGGAVIGNAFKTIFARVGRSTTIEQLRELGVAIDESQSGVERLRAIGDAIQQALGAGNQGAANRIRELSGGVRQINIVAAAFNDLNREVSIFDQALSASVNSTDQAIRRNERLNETLAALANESLVSVQELLSSIGEVSLAGGLNNFLKGLNAALGSITSFFEGDSLGAEIGENLLQGIGGFITGPGILLLSKAFVQLLRPLAKDIRGVLNSLNIINSTAERSKAIQSQIEAILTSQNKDVQAQLAGAKNKVELERTVLRLLQQQVAASAELAALSGGLARSPRIGGVFNRQGRLPNAAEGFIPADGLLGAVSRENAAISQRVGGSGPDANPVFIPDFNFGGGKRGPLIANSDEYIVENFDGKGSSAILTPQMVDQLGGLEALKRLGGKPVPNAQGGFFPEEFSLPTLPTGSLSPLASPEGKQLRKLTLDFNRAIRDFKEGLETGNTALQRAARGFVENAKLSRESQQLVKQTLRSVENEFTRVQPRIGPTRIPERITTTGAGTTVDESIGITARINEEQAKTQAALQRFADRAVLSDRESARVFDALFRQEVESSNFTKQQVNAIIKSQGRGDTEAARVNRAITETINTRIRNQRAQAIRLERSNRDAARQVAQPRESIFRRAGRSAGRAFRNPIGLSIAGSLLTPFIDQAAQGTTGATRGALGTTSGALTGASFGALLGPQGAAAGAAVGGLVGLAKALDDVSNNAKELTSTLDAQVAKSNELNNSFQQFINRQVSLNELIEAGADSARIREAAASLQSSLGGIEDRNIQSQISRIISNPELNSSDTIAALQSLAVSTQQTGERQTRLLEAILRANEAEVSGRGFLNVGGIFGETNIGTQEISGVANEITAAINLLSRETPEGGTSDFSRISETFRNLGENFNEDTFVSALEEIGVSSEEAGQLLEALGNDLDRLELFNEIRENLDISEEVNQFVEATIRYRTGLRETNRVFDNLIGNVNRIGEARRAGEQTQFSREQGQLEGRFATAQFSDPLAEAISEIGLEIRELNFDARQNADEISDEFRTSIAGLIDREVFDPKITRLLENIATDSNFSLDSGVFNQISELIEKNGSKSIEAYNEIINLGLNSLGQLNIIRESNQQQRDQLRQQLDIARRRAAEERRQARVGFLGGASNILSGQNAFANQRQRGGLNNAIDRGGLAGDVALSQQARALVDLRESFDNINIELGADFDRNFRQVVGEALTANITRSLASAGIDTQVGGQEISRIVNAQLDELTGENELTAEEIANQLELKLGEDLSSTAENTEESNNYLQEIIGRFERLSNILVESQKLTDLQEVGKNIAAEINNLQARRQTVETAVDERVLSSRVAGNLSGRDIGQIFGADTAKNALEEINRQRAFANQAAAATGRGNIRPLEDLNFSELLAQGAEEFNRVVRQNANSSVEEVLDIIARENRGVLSSLIEASPQFRATDQGFEGGNDILREFFLNNQSVIDFRGEAQEFVDAIGDLTSQIQAAEERFNEANQNIENQFDVLKGVRTPPNQNATPVSPSNPPLNGPNFNIGNILSDFADRGSQFLERARLAFETVEQNNRLSERQTNISQITGANIDNGQFVGSANQIAQAEFLEGDELRSQVAQINTGTLSSRELEAALQSLDEQLESLGLNLDDENIQRFLFGQGAGTTIPTEGLIEGLRVIREEARATGDAIRNTFEDPFSSFADRTDVLLEAATKLEFLKEKFGETSEEVQQFRDSLQGFEDDVPEGVFDRFFSGFLSQADRVDQALADIGQIGRDVSDQLSSGFADAFLGAISGTEDLQTSLRSLFSQVFADMAKLLAQRAFAQAFGSIGSAFGFGFSEGGSVQGLNTGGEVLRRNRGGSIFGAGDAGKMPTLLTGGEFVAGPDLVQRYGREFFEGLNAQQFNVAGSVTPAAAAPLGPNSTGVVQGGSGVRDDRFHMLHEGSYVINRAATQKYKDVLGNIQSGKDIRTTRAKEQKAFWGMLIGSVLGGAVGYATTGDWKGAAIGALGGAFLGQGVSNIMGGSGFFGSGGASGFFNPTTAQGASTGAASLGQTATQSLEVAGSNQFRAMGNLAPTEAIEASKNAMAATEGITAASEAAKGGSKLTAAGVQIGGSLIMAGISAALTPSNGLTKDDGSVPYEPGFVVDTQPDGTVTVMGDNGLQTFKLGKDINSLEDLKGVVPGYNRGGSVNGEGRMKVRDNVDPLALNLRKRSSETGVLNPIQANRRNNYNVNAAMGGSSMKNNFSMINGMPLLMRNDGGPVQISHFRDAAVEQQFLQSVVNKLIARETPESIKEANLFKDTTTPNTPAASLIEKRLSNVANQLSFNTQGSGADMLREVRMFREGGLGALGETLNTVKNANFQRPVSPLVMGGESTHDSVPALLKKSEFVMKDSAVSSFGVGFMNMVNNGDVNGVRSMLNINRMQDGGMVGSEPIPTNSRGNFEMNMRESTSRSDTAQSNNSNMIDIDIIINIDGQTGAVTSDILNTDQTRNSNEDRDQTQERFTRLAERLRPVIREEVSNELRVGGQIQRKINR